MKVKETFICWSHILSIILFYITFLSRNKSCIFGWSASLCNIIKGDTSLFASIFRQKSCIPLYDDVFQLIPALAVDITTSSDSIHFLPHGAKAPNGPGPPRYRGLKITLTHMTLSRSPLDEWSALRRKLYLTTSNNHNRHTSMPRRDSNPQSQQASGRRITP
jgi:hypothetical protein